MKQNVLVETTPAAILFSVTIALPLNPPPGLRDSRQLRIICGRGDCAARKTGGLNAAGALKSQMSTIQLVPFSGAQKPTDYVSTREILALRNFRRTRRSLNRLG